MMFSKAFRNYCNWWAYTCASGVRSKVDQFVLVAWWPDFELAVLCVAFVASEIFQIDTQLVAFRPCQPVKRMVACRHRTIKINYNLVITCFNSALLLCTNCSTRISLMLTGLIYCVDFLQPVTCGEHLSVLSMMLLASSFLLSNAYLVIKATQTTISKRNT